eukprot:TRINITY_DN156_c0_g1_i1.p1 TRINITY_DN156_c0_g1~~TRINITY_DN156_c0_g1_i1.p1  ORF type:complete len:480 (+),score=74.24 TRINITY_DN156_c0_g1_i1:100-1440(+)
MALSYSYLRRALTTSYFLLRTRPFSTPLFPLSKPYISSTKLQNPNSSSSHFRIQSLSFRSSSFSLSSSRSNIGDDDGKISPDTILFEGCDYNHWLITMDFPKDPKPTPEEMVETYVQTLAKVVGSVEEAKKRMYACSTTTYNGFQAVMTEEMSEKFRGLPGVVFILPDSYIDPVNKEYGGDKYINGTIIPRPPPVQYGRSGRYGDRNRNYDRPRYDRQRDHIPMQQGNPSYDRQNTMQGDGRNYAPQQNYGPTGQGDGRNYAPQQNYGPTGQGDVRNYAPQQNYVPTGPPRNYGPTGQGDGSNYARQRNYGPTGQGDRSGYGPPAGRDFAPAGERRDSGQGEGRDYGHVGGRDYGQGERRDPMPMSNRNYSPGGRDGYQSERRDPMPSYQRDFSQGQQRDYQSPEQSEFRRDYTDTRPSGGRDYRQGAVSGYEQSSSEPGEGQTIS